MDSLARTGNFGLSLSESLGLSGKKLHSPAPTQGPLLLAAYQQQLLCQSWPRVCKAYTGGSTAVVFESVGQRNPAARTLLRKANMVECFAAKGEGRKAVDLKVSPSLPSCPHSVVGIRAAQEHGRLLGELFDWVLEALNAPAASAIERCQDIGQSHIGLSGKGMTPRMWDDLGDCLIEFVCRVCPSFPV